MTKFAKSPCIVFEYDWTMTEVDVMLDSWTDDVISKNVTFQKGELFRVMLKISSITSPSCNHATLFFININLKKLGLKVSGVSFKRPDADDSHDREASKMEEQYIESRNRREWKIHWSLAIIYSRFWRYLPWQIRQVYIYVYSLPNWKRGKLPELSNGRPTEWTTLVIRQ